MKNYLLSAPASGAFWLVFLFILCFVGVHIMRLAGMGWQFRKTGETPDAKKTVRPESRREPPPQPQNPPVPQQQENRDAPAQPAQSPPEPVYYIVERKRKRSRDSYSPPKEIKFK